MTSVLPLMLRLASAGTTEWTPEGGVVDAGAPVTTAPTPPTPVSAPVLRAVLENQSARPLIVNVWASWCAPCVQELPTFEALATGGRANVILVNVDHPNALVYAARVGRSKAPSTRHLHLEPEDAATVFLPWPGSIPVTLVIAPGGAVKARFVGSVDEGQLTTALESS